jgi:hypothetical protein
MDRNLAEQLGKAGAAHVMQRFSMIDMSKSYIDLFGSLMKRQTESTSTICISSFNYSQQSKEDVVFCTIVTPDYLDRAIALYLSLRVVLRRVALMILTTGDAVVINIPGVRVIDVFTLCQLDGLAETIWRSYRLDNDILRWALKPVFISYLLRNGAESVMYCDCDVSFFEPPLDLLKLLDNAGVVITPHWRPRDSILGMRASFRLNFLDGLYNSGCVAANSRGLAAIEWWGAMCATACEKNY